jgi:predicted SAM-dependent methyltransferase
MKENLTKVLSNLGLLPIVLMGRGLICRLLSKPKWNAMKKQGRIWLELGSGPKRGNNGWTTIDISGADISHDLRLGIPLPDQTVDRIYTSHMFEHIPYKELVVFVNECYRVLKVGGELSVCVPNAGLYLRSYVAEHRFRTEGEGKGYGPAFVDTGSLIDQVNYIAYMDGHHKYMFDDVNLVNTLKKAPFLDVRLRDFDESIDLLSRDYESVYASAVK